MKLMLLSGPRGSPCFFAERVTSLNGGSPFRRERPRPWAPAHGPRQPHMLKGATLSFALAEWTSNSFNVEFKPVNRSSVNTLTARTPAQGSFTTCAGEIKGKPETKGAFLCGFFEMLRSSDSQKHGSSGYIRRDVDARPRRKARTKGKQII